MLLSIVLPARNEELLIKDTLSEIEEFLKKRKIPAYEILVVINGTSDNTEKIVSAASAQNRKIKVLHSKPGYGLALKKGLKEANGNYIAIFNVDFYDLKMLDLASIDLYGKDLIIGSKMTNWSQDERPLSRRAISFLFNVYLRLFFGFKGSDTHGIKLVKNEVVRKILPKCKTESGIFDTEFVLRIQKTGYEIADFPVRIKERRPPRFKQRLFETPRDIVTLSRVFRVN